MAEKLPGTMEAKALPIDASTRDGTMHSIFYLIGVVVVVLFVLSFLGLA